MINHVHLRDIRGEDLDLGPPAAQVDQDPAWGGESDQTDLSPAQLHLPTGVYKHRVSPD